MTITPRVTPTQEQLDIVEAAKAGDRIKINVGGSLYDVYSNGEVYSYNKSKFLNIHDNKKGYLYVNLFDSSLQKAKRYYVHRLVAMCFLPNPNNLPDVNHKDCNKGNNFVDNLEWSSRKDNMSHARENDRFRGKFDTEQKVREGWLGQVCGNRKVIKVLSEKSPSKNYMVMVECLLCGNNNIKMAQNDFKKARAKTCTQCRVKKLGKRLEAELDMDNYI